MANGGLTTSNKNRNNKCKREAGNTKMSTFYSWGASAAIGGVWWWFRLFICCSTSCKRFSKSTQLSAEYSGNVSVCVWVCVSPLWVCRHPAWSGSRPRQRRNPPDCGASLQQRGEQSRVSEDHVTRPSPNLQSLDSPVVEKIPPTMPHSLTRNCHSGMCCSLTVTISELVSYLTKIPETPWLPAAWLITRSCRERGESTEVPYSERRNTWVLLLTRSVTENWCVSAEILYVLSLVGTTVMKYWNIWLSAAKREWWTGQTQ